MENLITILLIVKVYVIGMFSTAILYEVYWVLFSKESEERLPKHYHTILILLWFAVILIMIVDRLFKIIENFFKLLRRPINFIYKVVTWILNIPTRARNERIEMQKRLRESKDGSIFEDGDTLEIGSICILKDSIDENFIIVDKLPHDIYKVVSMDTGNSYIVMGNSINQKL